MNKKAIVYTRVSTEGQAEGNSIQSQLEDCREFAAKHDMNIVAEFTDVESGGTHDREGFNELEIMLARKEADTVIAHKSDRLSRNLAEKLILYEEWNIAGIRLFYCDTGEEDLSDKGFIRAVIPGILDHEERRRIRERTTRGRFDKAIIDKKPVLNGQPPYGYRKRGIKKDAEMVKYEPELKVVRDIFEWYTRGDDDGVPMSLRKISKKLEDMGVPSTAPNKEWTLSRLHRILHHEIYIGVYYYGKTRTKTIKVNGRRKKIVLAELPKEEWIKIPVPHLAIIDREAFEAAQERKERNIKLQLRNNKRKYLMSGHYKCSCGKAMTGYQMNGYLRYECATNKKTPGREQCSTHTRSVVCHKVDTLVWDWICQLLTDEQSLEDGLNKMIENNKDHTGTKRKRLESLKILTVKREKSIKRLVTELSEGDYSDEFTRNIFQKKIEENTIVIKELKKEQEQLKTELARVEITEDFRREIKAMAAQVREKLADANFDCKRAVMDKLDLKAVFRYEDANRWLDLTCNLSPEGLSYALAACRERVCASQPK